MNKQANYILLAIPGVAVLSILFIVFQTISFNNRAIQKEYSKESDYSKPAIQYTESALKGKSLFMSQCASCHQIFKNSTGPGLFGFEDRGPWKDRKNVYEWIRNPSSFMAKNKYAKELYKEYGAMMTAFPNLEDLEIDAICDYINQSEKIRYAIVAVD